MITETVTDIWDHDDYEDKIFNSLYALSENKYWNPSYGGNIGFRDIMIGRISGCYFPPKGRAFYSTSIDLKNDGLPGICHLSGCDDFFFYGRKKVCPSVSSCTIYPIKSVPSSVRVPGGCALYKMVFWEFFENGAPENIGWQLNPYKEGVETVVYNTYVAVNKSNDRVIPCFHKDSDRELHRDIVKFIFCTTVSSEADRRFLWNVSLHYPLIGDIRVWIDFGVFEEHVKSIFFARDMPLSVTARKRPIQHWVSSHKRRVKDGIDININRYLRGVTEFKMHGYDFIISSPRKHYDHPLLRERSQIIAEGLSAPKHYEMDTISLRSCWKSVI